MARLKREKSTLEKMIAIYCGDHHYPAWPECQACRDMLAYARERLTHCPYGEDKPACSKCPTHCYRPELREEVIAVMRYAGPRMLGKHPILTVRHLIDVKKGGGKSLRRKTGGS